MSSGIQVTNASGILQIDETYRRLLKVASGTCTTLSGSGTNVISFTAQTTCAPLIFFRPASDGVYVGPNTFNNNSFSVQNNGNFDWVVYGLDSPVALDGTTMGMQVFDTSGSTIYDSRYEGVRIQSTYTVTQPYPDSYLIGAPGAGNCAYPYTYTFTGWGAKPWICLNGLFWLDDGNSSTICATTSGTNAIIINCGCILSGTAWSMYTNNGSSGSYTRSYPGGVLRVPVARRDF